MPGYTPVNDYTRAALNGDMNKATEICRSLNPLRSVLAKWIPGYGGSGRMAIAEQKFWMECIGMVGGVLGQIASQRAAGVRETVGADLEATGLIARAKAGSGTAQQRAA